MSPRCGQAITQQYLHIACEVQAVFKSWGGRGNATLGKWATSSAGGSTFNETTSIIDSESADQPALASALILYFSAQGKEKTAEGCARDIFFFPAGASVKFREINFGEYSLPGIFQEKFYSRNSFSNSKRVFSPKKRGCSS